MSIEGLADALNRVSTAAGSYLVGVWIGCALVGGLYSSLLLRRARSDQERLRGQAEALEYSAESTAGRVWIRTKTFLEFLAIGACAVLLGVPGGTAGFLLAKATARLLYLLLFINIILELAYNAWRDDRRDTHLRRLLDAQHRDRQAALDAAHTLRRVLADARQPEGEAEEKTAP